MRKMYMCPNHTKGKLFTFCGLVGCGKTTMMRRLIADLENDNQIFITKQPTDFVRNSEIFRTYMDMPDHDSFDYRALSLLCASDRVQHVNKMIVPAMKQGQLVLSDRYFYSCLANLRARGFDNDQWIYEIAESVVQPDIAFFFDVPVEMAVSRVRSRAAEKNRYIDIDLQYKLREEYLDICRTNGGVLIPTILSEEESYAFVKQEVSKVLNNDEC